MKKIKSLAVATLLFVTGCVAENPPVVTSDPLLDDIRFVYHENYKDLPAVIETMDGLDVSTKVRLLESIRDEEVDRDRRDVLSVIIDGYKQDL